MAEYFELHSQDYEEMQRVFAEEAEDAHLEQMYQDWLADQAQK